MVTGDSQEEVIIFRDTQTDRHFIIIYISSSPSLSSSVGVTLISGKLLKGSSPDQRKHEVAEIEIIQIMIITFVLKMLRVSSTNRAF